MQSAGQQTIRGVGRWEGSRLAREKQPLSVRPGRSERGGGGRELCCLKGPVRLPHMCVPCGRGTGGGKERLTVDHGTRQVGSGRPGSR